MTSKRLVLMTVAMGLLVALGVALIPSPGAYAHCQIPCGIYDDAMRFNMMREHVTTIEKSMNLINELKADPSENANQLARWVMNKEDHADYLAGIVTEYFLQQRVKLAEAESDPESYNQKLALCHGLLVNSMKAKQTTDLEYCEKLRELIDGFEDVYFTEEQKAHMKEHGHGHSH